MPDRLKYCEGFEVSEWECSDPSCHGGHHAHFNHHAHVLDTVTGQVHEVTPHHTGKEKYIYRTFWRHELGICGPTDDPDMLLYDSTPHSVQNYDPTGYNDTYAQLTLKAQYDLLRENGYDVELWAVRMCRRITSYCDTCHCGMAELIAAGKAEEYDERLVDMDTEDMSLCSYYKDEEGSDFQRYYELNHGWEYEWRLAEGAAMKAGAL